MASPYLTPSSLKRCIKVTRCTPRTTSPKPPHRSIIITHNYQQHSPFSLFTRSPPTYPSHTPLTPLERASLAFTSALGSLLNPRRADLIATVGETTATPYFIYRLRDAMLSDATGRRILRARPRITSKNMSLEKLRLMPANTLGRAYAEWLDREGVTPDTRSEVRYIDDEECAYVMQRYRECHDFYHALTGLPTVREGEVALKAFEFANTLLPMTGLAVGAVTTLKRGERRRFWEVYGPWAVRNGVRAKEMICVFWEECLERDVGELRRELGVEIPPDLRQTRRAVREKSRAEKLGVQNEVLA